MCVYRCVYSTSAVSMPVHNWCCAGNLHICKLPVYSQTSSHKHSKSTNRPDTALAEKCQDKQHPTSKLGSLFFFLSALPLPLTCLLVSASFFPLCSLFFFVPFIFSTTSFYLFYVPLITHRVPCPLLPLFTPPPSITPNNFFHLSLPSLLPSWMFVSNIYYQPLRASNLVETLSKITAYLCRHTTMKDGRKYWRVINITWRQSKFIFLFQP